MKKVYGLLDGLGRLVHGSTMDQRAARQGNLPEFAWAAAIVGHEEGWRVRKSRASRCAHVELVNVERWRPGRTGKTTGGACGGDVECSSRARAGFGRRGNGVHAGAGRSSNSSS